MSPKILPYHVQTLCNPLDCEHGRFHSCDQVMLYGIAEFKKGNYIEWVWSNEVPWWVWEQFRPGCCFIVGFDDGGPLGERNVVANRNWEQFLLTGSTEMGTSEFYHNQMGLDEDPDF